MDYKDIKNLMHDMENSKLNSFDIAFPDGTKIKMEKNNSEVVKVIPISETENPVSADSSSSDRRVAPKEDGNIVTSPMVGTFYSKSSPTANPFVEIGSKVKKGDTLCIIEAMKLMNEIESEYDGIVTEILVRDEEIIDYGKKLFVIRND